MGSEPMQVTHMPLAGAAPGAPAPGGTAHPDTPLGAENPADVGIPAGFGIPADPDVPPGPDMPAAAALYQLAAVRGGRGDVAAISAESGLGEERAAAGWRTLAGLALVRISGGQVETLGSDAALDAVVGRYASYAFEALRSVRAVNDTTRRLLAVFGSGAPGPGGIPAVLPFPGAAYTPYDDRDASQDGLLPEYDEAPGEVSGGIRGVGIGTAELPYADVVSTSTGNQEPCAVRGSAKVGDEPRAPGPRTGREHPGPERRNRDRRDVKPQGSERRGERARERRHERTALTWEFGTGSAIGTAPDARSTRGRERVLRALTESTVISADCLHGGALPGDPAVLEAYLEMTARLVLRGVRVRALCTPATLSAPGGTRYARDIAAAGAQVRVVDRVGHNMLICDGRTVCLPDTGCGDPADPAVLRVTNAQLARTFLVVYEAYWQRAAPFLPDGAHTIDGHGISEYRTHTYTNGDARLPLDDHELPSPVPQLGSFEQAVVRLMAGGRGDADIARELGVSAGAVDAVMTSLMHRLGAANRFEAGLRFARTLDGGRLP